MRWNDLTRRRLLAGLGSTGVASVAGLTLTTRDAIRVAQTTEPESTPAYTLEAEWRETYNGEVREDTTVSQTSEGAAISLQNVTPGDSGVFSFELRLHANGNGNVSRAPRLTLALTETAENGHTEPESKVDQTEGGDLQDFLDVALWYDTGLASVDAFGANNGVKDLGEGLITDDAAGTLPEVAEAVNGVSLGCLGPGETVTVTFGWEFLQGGREVNKTQGDSVTFSFDVTSEPC